MSMDNVIEFYRRQESRKRQYIEAIDPVLKIKGRLMQMATGYKTGNPYPVPIYPQAIEASIADCDKMIELIRRVVLPELITSPKPATPPPVPPNKSSTP